jgi:ribonucleoside-diphosphate reductase alpha chain
MAQELSTPRTTEIAPETLEFFGGDELRIRCFLDKYALRDLSGKIIEKTPIQMWERVAREIASVEPDAKKRREWEKKFYWLLEDFRFIPGGRIMFGAGQPRRATLLNCYVVPIKEDSIEGIFEWCKEAARTYSLGGGVGCVAKGSYVITRDGVKRIEDVQEGEEVLSYNPVLQQKEFRRVLQVHRPIVRRADNVAIYLKDGTRLITSRWHPTLVFREDRFQYVPAAEVRPTDAMLVTPELHTLPLNSQRLHDPQMAWWTGAHLGDGTAYQRPPRPLIRDYQGRGRERRPTRVKFYNRCKEVAQEYARIFNERTGSALTVHLRQRPTGPLYEVATSSYEAGDLIDLYVEGLYGKKATRAEIPRWIWNASRESQLAFLAGLIDTDGHVAAARFRVEFNTSSKELAYGLKTLLALLGARAWISTKPHNHQGQHSVVRRCQCAYRVATSDTSIVSEIARYMVNPEKKRRLLEGTPPPNNRDPVAVPAFVRDFLKRHATYKQVGHLRYNALKGLEKGWINRKTFLKLIEAIIAQAQDPQVYYQALSFRSLCLSLTPVEKVVAGVEADEEFCDLTVEGNNNYFAGEGGLSVIHNTDISILRPKGSPVNNSAIYSSGSVSFMELFSTTTGTIGQSGRRGALMITISVDHPDVLDFIEIKNDPERRKVQYANISVRVTDEFMRAVERDEEFLLRYESERIGRFERRVRAREIWEKLVKNAWASAEPGVIFWDTVKRESTTEYNGMEVITTNPCSLTGETRVFTPQGLIRLDELVLSATLTRQMPRVLIDRRAQDKKGIDAVVADRVAFTGIKPIWRVETSSGFILRGTCDHKVKVLNSSEYDREHQSYGWKRIDELRPGDILALPDLNDENWIKQIFSDRSWELHIDESYVQPRRRDAHYRLMNIPTRWTEDLAYLLGYAVGDGSYTTHTKSKDGRSHSKRLDLHMNAQEAPELHAIFSRVTESLLGRGCTLKSRPGTQHSWISIFAAPFQRLLQQLGLHPEKGVAKHVPEPIFRAPQEITAAFLRGLFDADGTVSTPSQRPMIALSSISERLIREVQLLLLQFGIFSSITVYKAADKNRRRTTPFRYRTVSGEERIYQSKHDLYKLCITSYPCLERFARYIGSALTARQRKIAALLAHRTMPLRPVTTTTKVTRVVPEDLCEPVYDLTVFDTKSFLGNGLIVSNSEIPLEAYGACCLGNVNLSKFVLDSFTPNARIDWPTLEKALRYAVRFLDDVLDYNADKHPLPAQREASLRSRRIGVGFTGFGDMLIKLGLKYDSDEAIAFTDKLFERIKHIVYDESTELAVEKGTFPAFDREQHLRSAFIKRLDRSLIEKIKSNGLRNAALLTVPPVGSGSVLAGCSSGIEPIFSLSYVRKSKSLSKSEFEVSHPLVREYMEKMGLSHINELPKTFVTAHEIEPIMRVRMQATIQKHIDHAISSTVNLAKDVSPETIGDIYFEAWKAGCKGITVYREGSREGILLTKEAKEGEKPARATLVPRPRPKVVKGKTYRMKTELGTVFITVNEDDEGIFEVFVQGLGKSGTSTAAFTEAIGRLISLALRSGVKPSAIIDQLSLIRGSRPVVQEDGTVVFSVPDAIAKAIAEYLRGGEQLTLLQEVKPRPLQPSGSNGHDAKRDVELCPSCGGILMFTNGCYICNDCGFSECD